MSYSIRIEPKPAYLAEHSDPANSRYAFAYQITLHNQGEIAAKLLARHWVITDGNGKVEEVRGEGVIGEQPHLQPGESFRYTSWAVIETVVGSMEGSYQMLADDGTRFEAPIPMFTLAVPNKLN
jgi:ApaG protein